MNKPHDRKDIVTKMLLALAEGVEKSDRESVDNTVAKIRAAAVGQAKKSVDNTVAIIKAAAAVQTKELIRRSVLATAHTVGETRDKMKKKSVSTDGKLEIEELRSKLMDIWLRDTAAPSTSKTAVDEFADVILARRKLGIITHRIGW